MRCRSTPRHFCGKSFLRSNDLKAAGVAPVIIAFFNLDLLKNWIKDTNCTFPVYLDSNMSTYQAFGLPRSMKALRIPTMRWFGERMANGRRALIFNEINGFLTIFLKFFRRYDEPT